MSNLNTSVALGCLFLVFGVAVGIGLLIHKLEVRKGLIDRRDQRLVGDGVGGALGFIGGSAAFLMGVLMLASIDHYHATDDIVTGEALAYSAAFDGAAALAPADRTKVQRDLVCLMRSVATKSWDATQAEDLTGSENTHEWRARTFEDANAVEPKTPVQENGLATLQSQLIESSKSGQERLLAAHSDLPAALWILTYASIFALTVALTALLRPYPVLATTTLAAILLLSAAMVWVLTAFAEPFTKDDGVFISPRALNSVMIRLQGTYPKVNWGECEEFAPT